MINSVLLIDNNEIDIYVNKKVLEDYGVIQVTSFSNAISALLHLRNEPKVYDLILINTYLPVMDAFEFIESFNKSELFKVHGKIYLLSASINPDHIDKAHGLNVNFIEKPLNPDKLMAVKPP